MGEDMKKRGSKHKRYKIIIGTMIFFCSLLIVYFGVTAYFMNHFYFKSEINCVSVAGKTSGQADKKMESKIKSYKLNLKELDGKSEQISAEEIGLKYNSKEDFKKLKDDQEAYKWVTAFFSNKNSKMTVGVSYDKNLLKEKVDKLLCFDSKNVVEPKNPNFNYTNKCYVVTGEVNGNKVDKKALYDNIEKAILNGKSTIDLKTMNCYITPKYNLKSKETTEIRDTLNKYASSQIIYTFGDSKETLDGSTISAWLTVDDNYKIKFDEEKVAKYMSTLANAHDTIGRTRKFVTTSGRTVNVSGGDYGWCIDAEKETQNLIAIIKEGKTVTKEPAYTQTAVSHSDNDFGNTYVEIDIPKQHLWFYKNGSLVVQGNVVTGNESDNHATPSGIYRLKYKERHATLRGERYEVPVDYWMPFNGGIGMHDATWRKGEFGGNIYMTDGSHGCVNESYDLAKTIFNSIDEGTPVVVFR